MNKQFVTREEWLANKRDCEPRPFPKIVRQFDGFYLTADGRYWVLNQQLGYVEVRAESSRALRHALLSEMPADTTLRILYDIDTPAERRAFALGMQAAASKAMAA